MSKKEKRRKGRSVRELPDTPDLSLFPVFRLSFFLPCSPFNTRFFLLSACSERAEEKAMPNKRTAGGYVNLSANPLLSRKEDRERQRLHYLKLQESRYSEWSVVERLCKDLENEKPYSTRAALSPSWSITHSPRKLLLTSPGLCCKRGTARLSR